MSLTKHWSQADCLSQIVLTHALRQATVWLSFDVRQKNMSTLEFISSLVGSTVWPITVVALSFCFRSELRGLLRRLTRIKYGESEAEFQQQIQAAFDQVEKASGGDLPGLETIEAKRIFSIHSIDPKAALIAAWVEFEGTARQTLYGQTNEDVVKSRPAPFVIDKLKEKGLLAKDEVNLLGLLRQLRNVALHHHDSEIDAATSLNAITVLLQLTWELQNKK